MGRRFNILSLLALLSISIAFIGCEKPTDASVDAKTKSDVAKTTKDPKLDSAKSEAAQKAEVDKVLKIKKWPDANTITIDGSAAKYAGTWVMRMTPAQVKEFKDAKSTPTSTLLLGKDSNFTLKTNVAMETVWGVAVFRDGKLFLAKRKMDSEFDKKNMVTPEMRKQDMRIPVVLEPSSDGKKLTFQNFGQNWEYFKKS